MLEFFAKLLNPILSPLLIFHPMISISIIAFLITILILLINRIFVKKNMMSELKMKIENLREQLIAFQKEGNVEKMKEIIDEITKENVVYMKQMVKVLLISIVVVVIFLPWVQQTYKDATVAKLPLVIPYIGSNLNWFVWYFLVSVAIGWVLRKLLGVEYG
ncbi:MAG: EMC3/TMCO1 family protein [Candidatus Aenigmatarchaeota archaeon]